MTDSGGTGRPPVEIAPRTWAAVLWSLFVPGGGHVFAGRLGKGPVLWVCSYAFIVLVFWSGALLTFKGYVLGLTAIFALTVVLAISAARAAAAARGAKPGRRRWAVLAAMVCLQSVIGPLFAESLPLRSFRIPTQSMEPAIMAGDRLVADLRAWDRREPVRGDLVIFRPSKESAQIHLARVMGLPGERIEMRDKRIYVDGAPVEDPWGVYLDTSLPAGLIQRTRNFGPLSVPEGTVFVLGDSRDSSRDSRFLGSIDRTLLIGQPRFVSWSSDGSRIGRSLADR